MIVKRYEEIYKLVEELQKEYKSLYKIENNLDSFQKYQNVKNSKKNIENKFSNIKDNNIILKNTIKKDKIIINIYLIKLKYIKQPQLDKNYKVLPLEEKEIYQYGTIITIPLYECLVDINDVFSNYAYEEEKAKIEYTKLINYLEKLTKEELLNKLENTIKNELFFLKTSEK